MSTIDEVKARLDIVDTVSGYVSDLKKSGRAYKALCPFHSERTPSFTVDPERGRWHCFGACSTGGDVIEFVRRIERVEFPEALRICAQRAGVELRPPSQREQEQRETHERLLRANEAAAVYFQAALGGPGGAAARRYLDGRGLDAETRTTWQLGYAPGGWRGLLEHLQGRGFSEDDLLEAGLAVRGDRGPYDRFRDRLIFPTRDARGRLIGFGARALRPEDEPKYLNTPQTPLFDKSGTLYGLDRAAEPARRADRLVVVEGYMDVIAAHQFGIENVVASMGTAITEKQMALVKRLTRNVVLALDADTAGSAATLRGVEVAAGAADHQTVATVDWRGLVRYQDVLQADIRVVTMPGGEDPDSMVRADPQRFRDLLRAAKPVADHLFDAVAASADLTSARERSLAVETLSPTVAAIADPVVRAHYVQRLARIGQVDERTVTTLLLRTGDGRAPAPLPSRADRRREGRQRDPQTPDGEAQLLQLLLLRPEGRAAGLALDPDTFEDTTNRRLFAVWCELDGIEALDERLDELLDELDEDVRERIASLRSSAPESVNPGNPGSLDARYVTDMVAELAWRLRLRRAQARLAPAAVEQAHAVQQRRQDGEAVTEAAARVVRGGGGYGAAANEVGALAADFVEMSQRQRALTRDYRTNTGRRPSERSPAEGAGDDRKEQADDADV